MRNSRLKNWHVSCLAVLAMGAGLAFAQQAPDTESAGSGSSPPAGATATTKPSTAQKQAPPKRPGSFKPTEEVRADTILTLPSDI